MNFPPNVTTKIALSVLKNKLLHYMVKCEITYPMQIYMANIYRYPHNLL